MNSIGDTVQSVLYPNNHGDCSGTVPSKAIDLLVDK